MRLNAITILNINKGYGDILKIIWYIQILNNKTVYYTYKTPT